MRFLLSPERQRREIVTAPRGDASDCVNAVRPLASPRILSSRSSAMAQWIVTAVGPDRPGIVGELTGHLHAAGANLLDSRMVNLRGQFALVLLMECPDASPASTTLADALPQAAERM